MLSPLLTKLLRPPSRAGAGRLCLVQWLLVVLVAVGCTSASPKPDTGTGAKPPAAGSKPAAAAPTTPTTPVGPERAERTTRALNLAGFPPEYRSGFTAGCASVGSPAAPIPPGEASFRQGYRDGASHCLRRPPT